MRRRRRRRHDGVEAPAARFAQKIVDRRFYELTQREERLAAAKLRRRIVVEALARRLCRGSIGEDIVGKLPVELVDGAELRRRIEWDASDVAVQIDDLQRLSKLADSAQCDGAMGAHKRGGLVGLRQSVAKIEQFRAIRL